MELYAARSSIVNRCTTSHHPRRRGIGKLRLNLEQLEDRCLMANPTRSCKAPRATHLR